MNIIKDVIMTAWGKKIPANFTLNPNAGDVVGAIVTLTNNNSSQIYKQTAESTSVIFKAVLTGSYTLTVEHEDFFPYIHDDITIDSSESDYTIDLLKNGPATVTISSIGDSANGVTVKISNDLGMTIQSVVEGNIVTFDRLLPGILHVEVKFDAYSTFSEQNISAEKMLKGLNITIYEKDMAVGKKGLAGGIIFYDKGSISDGWRFLEAAPVETEFNTDWSSAISRCKSLNINGYTGWYLPSEDDLQWMYQNLHEKNLADFGKGNNSVSWKNWHYWSSAMVVNRNNYSWYSDFSNGSQHAKYQKDACRVRAVRAF